MKNTKDNTQTGKKNPKNERIAACVDEFNHILDTMLGDLCEIAPPTCREPIRVALLTSLAKDVEMLFGELLRKSDCARCPRLDWNE